MIYIVKGDCTEPINVTKNVIIPQINNNLGIAGSGLVMAIKEKWPRTVKVYEMWHDHGIYNLKLPDGTVEEIEFQLGQTQLIKAEDNIYVANMLAQSGIGYYKNLPPIRYGCLEECLLRLKDMIKYIPDHSLHMGEIGSARAGGSLDIIKDILNRVFPDTTMYMYQYEGKFK